jgi:hypothetical protein
MQPALALGFAPLQHQQSQLLPFPLSQQAQKCFIHPRRWINLGYRKCYDARPQRSWDKHLAA